MRSRFVLPSACRRFLTGGVLILVAVAVPAFPGEVARGAGTFFVNKTADTADGGCTAADCSLREAVIAANLAPGEDVIQVPPGTYSLDEPGQDEDSAFTGDLDVTGDVTINGRAGGGTTIDGSGVDRVFHVVSGATVQIKNLNITGGLADTGSGALGGGIYIESGSSLTVVRSRIAGNQANAGGGIASHGQLALRFSAVENNAALNLGFTNAEGGNLWANAGEVTLQKSLVANGSAAGFVAGAVIEVTSAATVEDTTIGANNGIGLRFQNASATVIGSTISGNAGGGLSIFSCCEHMVVVRDSIVAGNVGFNCNIPPISDGHNIDSGLDCGFTQTGDQQNTDPLLGPLADQGGPTRTYRLLPGSPALDQGSSGPLCHGTDQRGVPRPGGAGPCDVGAYEYETCGGTAVNRVGTDFKDVLSGTGDDDGMLAFGGSDRLTGKGGDDRLCGGGGGDTLKGGAGKDRLFGEAGRDRCVGGSGTDKAIGCEVTSGVP